MWWDSTGLWDPNPPLLALVLCLYFFRFISLILNEIFKYKVLMVIENQMNSLSLSV